MEIFRKAKELARVVYDENDPTVINRPSRMLSRGESNLHEQGARIFRMAWETAFKKKLDAGNGTVPDDCMQVSDVIDEIETLYQKHGAGWEKIEESIEPRDPLTFGRGKFQKALGGEKMVVVVKDYEDSDEIIDTLAFLKKMEVVFERQDKNEFKHAVHLRMTKDDYDMIFNPSRYMNDQRAVG